MTRGRYAPSPTGDIHLGNAMAALAAWLGVRAAGGVLVWRLEDLDAPRAVPGLAERQMYDLAWLGLDWDEGPDRGGSRGPYVQSERHGLYTAALETLERAGRLFPCRLTRRELRDIASAPHAEAGESPYPQELRPARLVPGWLVDVLADPGSSPSSAAVRLRVDAGTVAWVDLVSGLQEDDVQAQVGDFVLRRRDGVWAYQLAVVVDDAAMGIDQVVRGADLLSSTARQIVLHEALGHEPPRFAHVPLLLATSGDKLSKRDAPLTLGHLRDAGVSAEKIVGLLAYALGLQATPHPRTPRELICDFDWSRVRSTDMIVADETPARLHEGGDALLSVLTPAPEAPR